MREISKAAVPHVDRATFRARLWPCVREATPLALVWAVFATACRAPFFLVLASKAPSPIGLSPVWALIITFAMSYVLAIAVLATRAATYPEGTFRPTFAGVRELVRENWKPLAIAFAIAVPVIAAVWFFGMTSTRDAGIFFVGSVEMLIAMVLSSVQPTAKGDANPAPTEATR